MPRPKDTTEPQVTDGRSTARYDNCGWINQRLISGIEYVSVDSLKAYANNPRRHPKRQRNRLDRSLAAFGFVMPVIVDDENVVVAGEALTEAARHLGYTKVPVVRIHHLAPDAIKALRIALNRLPELAEWDEEKLAFEFQALVEVDFDVELTGFDNAEIDLTIDHAFAPVAAAPADQVPAIEDVAVTRLGDLWQLDEHLVLCGDAREPEAYSAVLQGRLAVVTTTDPPYNVRVRGNVCGSGAIKHDDFVMASGEMSEEEFRDFLEAFTRNAIQSSTPGSLHFIFMDWRHLRVLQEVCDKFYGPQVNLCVWVKSNGGMGSLFRSRHELVVVYKNGTAPHVNNVQLGRYGRNRTNVWEYEGANSLSVERRADLALHPTVKPVAMIADVIRDASNRGDLILDPFLGSGTAVIACEQTGRVCAGLELDPKYVDVAVRRWQAYTGNKARHAHTGMTFDEMADLRQGKMLLLPPPASGGEV
mgnify:FL=1|tara:strand:- start:2048 stop:3472 length:1425 start_codon:yes stop_codon:yes gene_type:complete